MRFGKNIIVNDDVFELRYFLCQICRDQAFVRDVEVGLPKFDRGDCLDAHESVLKNCWVLDFRRYDATYSAPFQKFLNFLIFNILITFHLFEIGFLKLEFKLFEF